MQLDENPFSKENLESQIEEEDKDYLDSQVSEDIFEEEKDVNRMTIREASFNSQRP